MVYKLDVDTHIGSCRPHIQLSQKIPPFLCRNLCKLRRDLGLFLHHNSHLQKRTCNLMLARRKKAEWKPLFRKLTYYIRKVYSCNDSKESHQKYRQQFEVHFFSNLNLKFIDVSFDSELLNRICLPFLQSIVYLYRKLTVAI